MRPVADSRIQDLGQIVLTLKETIRCLPRYHGTRPYYIVEDCTRSQFYRLGEAEYSFACLLDGTHTIQQALARTARTRPQNAFTEHQAANLCRWLIDNDLASTPHSKSAERLLAAHDDDRKQQRQARWNPFYYRLPLVRPDGFFDWLAPLGRLAFSRPMVAIWAALMLIATFQLANRLDQMFAETRQIWFAGHYWWMGASWVLLKLIHEIGHGLACKRYGGRVPEAGTIFILFAPIAYVDVTTSWRFRNKWQRIVTSSAGMYFESWVAAVAILVWSYTSSPVTAQLCHALAIMASLTTVIFNANPLMRFDGYYIFADAVEIPNLYATSSAAVRAAAKQFFLGIRSSPDSRYGGWQRALIVSYGWAAMFWRLTVCCGMLMASMLLLQGAGLILAVGGGILWFALPTLRFFHYLVRGREGQKPNRIRFVLTSSLLAATLLCLTNHVRSPFRPAAPAVVQYADLSVIRTAVPGFVEQVLVCHDQEVAIGQLLFVLRNDALEAEVNSLSNSIEQSQGRLRGHQQHKRMADHQAEAKQLEALLQKWNEKKTQLDGLRVHAPCSGRVLTRGTRNLSGTYLESGGELAAIGTEHAKEVRLSVAQEDLKSFERQLGSLVRLRMRGQGAQRARLDHVEPKASLRPFENALCVPYGGSLAVRQSDSTEMQLTTPRFSATVALSPQQSLQLRAGQRLTASLVENDRTLAALLYDSIDDWIHNRLSVKGSR